MRNYPSWTQCATSFSAEQNWKGSEYVSSYVKIPDISFVTTDFSMNRWLGMDHIMGKSNIFHKIVAAGVYNLTLDLSLLLIVLASG